MWCTQLIQLAMACMSHIATLSHLRQALSEYVCNMHQTLKRYIASSERHL